jgi:hypothetical protein
LIFSCRLEAIVFENRALIVLGQAAGLITFTSAEARTRSPGCHVDYLRGARSTVAAYVVSYKLRCVACQPQSRASFPQRLLDYATLAQAPAARSGAVSEPGFFCEPCGAGDVEAHQWAPRSLFRIHNNGPTAQSRPACHARRREVMRGGAWRL